MGTLLTSWTNSTASKVGSEIYGSFFVLFDSGIVNSRARAFGTFSSTIIRNVNFLTALRRRASLTQSLPPLVQSVSRAAFGASRAPRLDNAAQDVASSLRLFDIAA
jgi:hypothetical protein